MSFTNPTHHVPPPHGVPDHVIDNLLGQGLNATEWQTALEANNYLWKPILRNTFIRRELWFFKSEIEWLLTQPSFYTATSRKSNSCRSILGYIQGHSGERQQRLDTRRLCGPEITCRTLEAYVKNRRSQPSTSSLSSNTLSKTTSNADTSESAIPNTVYGYQIAHTSSDFELPQVTMDLLSLQPFDQQMSSASHAVENSTEVNPSTLDLGPYSENPSSVTVPLNVLESEPLNHQVLNSAASDLHFSSTYDLTSGHLETEFQNPPKSSIGIHNNDLGGPHSDFCCCEGCFPSGSQ